MKPGPAIAQKIGPLGINIGQIISKVNQETSDFKGMKVPVQIEVDPLTKKFTIKISSPPTAELLKKEFNLESGSGDHKKIKIGNASIEQIIKITKTKFPNMLAKEFKSAVKSILGTCASIGLLVEGTEANNLIKKIETGKFDKEIKEQITETSAEKKEKLDKEFAEIKQSQEKLLQEEAKAAEEAEAAKVEAKGKEGEAEKKKEEKTKEVKEKTEEKIKEKPKEKAKEK